MKQLEKKIKSRGFIFEQQYRNDDYAIYIQWLNNEIISYELIKIRKNKDWESFGKHFEACESYPNTNTWGKYGWTFKNYSDAVKRLNEYTTDLRNLDCEVNAEGTISQDLRQSIGFQK